MIRMHITVEGESARQCAEMLKATASAYYHLADAQRLLENAPKDGVRTELKIGDDVLAVVSVEDDVTLSRHGKMPLRWGPSRPAFERERQQYDFEKTAEKTDWEQVRAEVTESWDTGRGD